MPEVPQGTAGCADGHEGVPHLSPLVHLAPVDTFHLLRDGRWREKRGIKSRVSPGSPAEADGNRPALWLDGITVALWRFMLDSTLGGPRAER